MNYNDKDTDWLFSVMKKRLVKVESDLLVAQQELAIQKMLCAEVEQAGRKGLEDIIEYDNIIIDNLCAVAFKADNEVNYYVQCYNNACRERAAAEKQCAAVKSALKDNPL